MNAKHTPGPSAGARRAACRCIHGQLLPDNCQGESVERLARLIDRETAAPDLLAACEQLALLVLAQQTGDNPYRLGANDVIAAARAAIASATGKES